MKKIFLVLSLFLVLFVVLFGGSKFKTFLKDKNTQQGTAVELSCDNGYTMTARYWEPDTNGIMTRLSLTVTKDQDTRIYDMIPSISASGSKFETKDLKYSLWEHQGEFTFSVDEVDTAVCREKGE